MNDYELKLLEGISYSLKEILVEMKEANRLLGGICSVADKSLAQPATDMNAPINGDYPGKRRRDINENGFEMKCWERGDRVHIGARFPNSLPDGYKVGK